MSSQIKILIIDDDTVFLNGLLAQLSADHFMVRGADTGKEGLEEIKKWKPDLVVLDLMLPDTDGLEVLSSIRDTAETKSLPVIVCTNRGSDNDEKQCYSLGAKELLLKANYRLDQLVEEIKNAVKTPH